MKIKAKAVFTFCVFLTIVLKYVLVNKTGIIHLSRRVHGFVSDALMILLIAGLYYSLDIILDSYAERRKSRSVLTDINVMLSVPALVLFLYLIFLFIRIIYTPPS